MHPDLKHDLIVTIVKKGFAECIVQASKKAGSEGATIIYGRGTGIPIEPEKEIILTIIKADHTEQVLEAIIKAGKLEHPGTGIAFVLELKRVVGVVHLLKQLGELEPAEPCGD
jgi:nitrogen regulatory protein P-II 1